MFFKFKITLKFPNTSSKTTLNSYQELISVLTKKEYLHFNLDGIQILPDSKNNCIIPDAILYTLFPIFKKKACCYRLKLKSGKKK